MLAHFSDAIRVEHHDFYDLRAIHLTILAQVLPMDARQHDLARDKCEPLSEEERQRKVRFLRDQLLEYETPHERLWEMVVGQPSLIAAVKIGLDVNLFELWAEVCGGTLAGEQLTISELSWLVDVKLDTMSEWYMKHARYVTNTIRTRATASCILRSRTGSQHRD